jgi:hypothetical protein
MTNPDIQNTFTGIDLIPVVPSDTVDLPTMARGLRIGTGGTLRFVSRAGFLRNTTVATGEYFIIAVRRVHVTGTTATGIEAII